MEPHKHQLQLVIGLFKDEFLKILCLSENATQVQWKEICMLEGVYEN